MPNCSKSSDKMRKAVSSYAKGPDWSGQGFSHRIPSLPPVRRLRHSATRRFPEAAIPETSQHSKAAAYSGCGQIPLAPLPFSGWRAAPLKSVCSFTRPTGMTASASNACLSTWTGISVRRLSDLRDGHRGYDRHFATRFGCPQAVQHLGLPFDGRSAVAVHGRHNERSRTRLSHHRAKQGKGLKRYLCGAGSSAACKSRSSRRPACRSARRRPLHLRPPAPTPAPACWLLPLAR